MKKILSILAAVGLAATVSSSVVACGSKPKVIINGGGGVIGSPEVSGISYSSNGTCGQVIVSGTNLQQITVGETLISNAPKGTKISRDKSSTSAKLILDLYDANNNPVLLSDGTYSITLFYGYNQIVKSFTV